ncbi:MAG: hypothetical protein WBD47_05100 [Phormidesmis sp.]
MKNSARSVALDRRFPYLCKVLYFPPDQQTLETSHRAPTTKLDWYLRAPMMPRVGDVIPYEQYWFSVTTVILEDCCSADAISKVDKVAGRIAEKEDSPKWHAVVWVSFWGVASV